MVFDNNRTTDSRGQAGTPLGGCTLPMGILSVFDGVILITILIMSLFGNILVFVAIWRFRVLRSVTNTFIASLSAADLLVSLIPIPMSFAAFVCSWLPQEQARRPEDIAYLICDIMTSSVSILSLMAVAVDRCVAISSPYKYRNIMSRNKVIIIIVALWIVCFGSALLKLYIPGRNYTLYIIIVTYIIPVPIMLICYGKIYLIARFQAKRIYNLKRAVRRSERSSLSSNERRVSTTSTKTKKTSFSDLYPENCSANGEILTPDENVELRSISEKREDTYSRNSKQPSHEEMSLCSDKSRMQHPGFKLRKKSTFRSIRNRLSLSRYSISEFNRDLKAAKSLAVIMGAFLLTWSPFMAINFTYYFCPTCSLNYNVAKYFKFLHYSNSAINPILYALLNKKWWAAFTMMLCRHKKMKRPDYSHSELLSGW